MVYALIHVSYLVKLKTYLTNNFKLYNPFTLIKPEKSYLPMVGGKAGKSSTLDESGSWEPAGGGGGGGGNKFP